MIRRIFSALLVLMIATACNNQEGSNYDKVYTSKLECEAEAATTRVYNANLEWSWEAGDALRAYQVAGHNLRNTLNFINESANFVCEAFNYMSTDPETFHFIYPAAAEVSEGVLVAVQDGVWRPLSVTTVENATVESLPTLSFTMLSAALELRIFDTDKTSPIAVMGAKLSAEQDFVGKWTLQSDMTYEQSLDGKEMVVAGNDWSRSTVVFNMPDMPEGVDAGALTLTLTDVNGGTMTRQLPEMTFVKGKRTVLNIVYTADPVDDGGDEPVTPEPEEPGEITGTFTCATYNVDGLPEKILGFISLNGDGPGSNGTKNISSKIATSGWDVVTFQENFTYNSELQSVMKSYYTFGEHREFSLLSALGTADTDGLGFATLNSTCKFTYEYWWAFSDAYGGLTDGANTSLKKGVRHYVVKFNDGVEIDFLVTHMNSGSDSGHIEAREGQLSEIAAYINSIRSNNRPIVLMGDTNCRYTRDDFKTYFWDKLNGDLEVADPWVEYSWDGVYPELGSPSLMVPSKDSSSTLTEQTGEVVDKIIYINNPNAATQIKAEDYCCDADYAEMADHNPVRVKFTYTSKKTE